MDTIVKRARELYAKHAEQQGYTMVAQQAREGLFDLNPSMRAIVEALTPPEGYVLVPVELVTAIADLALIYEAGGDIDSKLSQVEGLIAARPEVP